MIKTACLIFKTQGIGENVSIYDIITFLYYLGIKIKFFTCPKFMEFVCIYSRLIFCNALCLKLIFIYSESRLYVFISMLLQCKHIKHSTIIILTIHISKCYESIKIY